MTQIIRMGGPDGNGPEMKKFEEIVLPNLPGFDPEQGLKFAMDFEYKKGDIIFANYPKTGTHWMGNMLWKLKSMDAKDRPGDTAIELGKAEAYTNQNDPRIIYTHLTPKRLVNAGNKAKIVLMLRNPKDALVSRYFHQKDAVLINNKFSFDEFFKCYMEGDIVIGSYFEFLREWEQALKDASAGESQLQIEVFYYEELSKNPRENIARLTAFLELNRDDEYLETVLKETSFDALREHYRKHASTLMHPAHRGADGYSVVFRKGQVGDWKNHVTVAQSEAVDKLLQESLPHGLIKFKFEP